jgi:hypothetical protein
VAGSCEYGDELSGSINEGNCLSSLAATKDEQLRLVVLLVRRSVAGFLSQRPYFKPRAVQVGFCFGQSHPWTGFSPRTSIFLLRIIYMHM